MLTRRQGDSHCPSSQYLLNNIQDSIIYEKCDTPPSLSMSAQEPDAGNENIICIWN